MTAIVRSLYSSGKSRDAEVYIIRRRIKDSFSQRFLNFNCEGEEREREREGTRISYDDYIQCAEES